MSSVIQGKCSYKTRYEFTWSTEELFKQIMRKQQTNSECGTLYRLTSLISTPTPTPTHTATKDALGTSGKT